MYFSVFCGSFWCFFPVGRRQCAGEKCGSFFRRFGKWEKWSLNGVCSADGRCLK